jgi:hypothetical protein
VLTAVARALQLRAEHGILGVASRAQLEAVVAASGLELWTEEPFEGRVWGAFTDGVIGVRRHLLPGTQLMVIAHETGHGLLGHANGFYRAGNSTRRLVGVEAEAHVFAWALLLGRPAPDMDGLTAQIQRGHRAGLPIDWLFTVVSILTTRFEAVRGTPLLQLS